jgi:hypothetical protein
MTGLPSLVRHLRLEDARRRYMVERSELQTQFLLSVSILPLVRSTLLNLKMSLIEPVTASKNLHQRSHRPDFTKHAVNARVIRT